MIYFNSKIVLQFTLFKIKESHSIIQTTTNREDDLYDCVLWAVASCKTQGVTTMEKLLEHWTG